MSNIEFKIPNVFDIICRYSKKEINFNCKMRREITTLEGNKTISNMIKQIDHIAIGSTSPHETEIIRQTIGSHTVHITFIKPTICHIESYGGQWGKNKRLKCIDWDKK